MHQFDMTFGPAYDPRIDKERLENQMLVIRDVMADGQWRTLQEIARITGYSEASISAQLRHLRKERFGGHTVNKRHVENGLWEYQLVLRKADDNGR